MDWNDGIPPADSLGLSNPAASDIVETDCSLLAVRAQWKEGTVSGQVGDTYLVDFGDHKEQIDIAPNCFNKAVMGSCQIDPDFKENGQASLLGRCLHASDTQTDLIGLSVVCSIES